MPTLAATAHHSTVPTAVHTFVHDVLPTFALAFVLMAVIWLACAIVYLAGGVIGYTAFLAVRRLIAACAERVRRRRNTEYAQLVTVHPDGVTTKIINLDHYRRRRQRTGNPNTAEHTDGSDSDSDEPA